MRNTVFSAAPLVLVVVLSSGCRGEPQAAYAQAQEAAPSETFVPIDSAGAVIRLLEDEDSSWVVWRDRSIENDPDREAGPLKVWGQLTFFGLPVAITYDDLEAGGVDVAIIGASLDLGTGTRGAQYGPGAFRFGTGEANSMETLIDWKSELVAVDFGNAPIDFLSVEKSMPTIRRMVREIAQTGAIPVVIGGDRSIEFASVAGTSDVHGSDNVGLVHFGATSAAGGTEMGHMISDNQPVRRLIEDGHVSGNRVIQVGLRGRVPGPEGFEWMRENRIRYHTMAEVDRNGWERVMNSVLDDATDIERLHVSFDLSVIDPVYAPATGTPVIGGLEHRQAFQLVRALCAENAVIGFDLLGFTPQRDPGYSSVLVAQQVVSECLTGVAMRKRGLGERDYYSPLAIDDDRGWLGRIFGTGR